MHGSKVLSVTLKGLCLLLNNDKLINILYARIMSEALQFCQLIHRYRSNWRWNFEPRLVSFVPELNYLPLPSLRLFCSCQRRCLLQEEIDGSASKVVFSFCLFGLTVVPSLLIEIVWPMKPAVQMKTGFFASILCCYAIINTGPYGDNSTVKKAISPRRTNAQKFTV